MTDDDVYIPRYLDDQKFINPRLAALLPQIGIDITHGSQPGYHTDIVHRGFGMTVNHTEIFIALAERVLALESEIARLKYMMLPDAGAPDTRAPHSGDPLKRLTFYP